MILLRIVVRSCVVRLNDVFIQYIILVVAVVVVVVVDLEGALNYY